MPIEVSPVKEVDIDLSEASKGDCLEVVFEDNSRIIMVVAKSSYRTREFDLTLPRELLPTHIYEAVAAQVLAQLKTTNRVNAYGQPPTSSLKSWWETVTSDEQPHVDIFTELLDAVLDNIFIAGPQIGEELSVTIRLPSDFYYDDQSRFKGTYVLGTVTQIVPRDPWVREVEVAILVGERQLHALKSS